MSDELDVLVEFQTAILAKEIGFPQIDRGWYFCSNGASYLYDELQEGERDYKRPTQSALKKWLREKFDMHVEVMLYVNKPKGIDRVFQYMISSKENHYNGFTEVAIQNLDDKHQLHETFEIAQEEGLLTAMNKIKKSK